MKKVIKIVGIVLACFILIWCLYVTVDCIRIRTIKYGPSPLVTLESIEEDTKLYYKGLGYSVTYQVETEREYDLVLIKVYGGEFRLFDKILIWSWSE